MYCKIFVYINGVAWRRKVGRGTKKKERKVVNESGVWGRLGVLPQNIFYRNRYEISILGISKHVEWHIPAVPQQEGRWYLCNMHNLIVIRFKNNIYM